MMGADRLATLHLLMLFATLVVGAGVAGSLAIAVGLGLTSEDDRR